MKGLCQGRPKVQASCHAVLKESLNGKDISLVLVPGCRASHAHVLSDFLSVLSGGQLCMNIMMRWDGDLAAQE